MLEIEEHEEPKLPRKTELMNKCKDELENMNQALIRFTLAWVALGDLMETEGHPSLFDDKEHT